jgi:hypothetical protein
MWRNSLEGVRDLYWASSTDGGKTFSEARKLGTGSWPLEFCPMDGGWLTATGSGEVTTVWQRDKQVFRTNAAHSSEEFLLGPGIQPWVTGTSERLYVVWLSRRPGDLWLSTPDESRPRRLASNATDPVIVSAVTGSGPVVVVWESGPKQKTSIFAEVVSR